MNKPTMDFPVLQSFQCALIHAERATGIVLTLKGDYWLGSGDRFAIFDSLDSAKTYALRMITINPLIECVIYDPNGIDVLTVRSDDPIPPQRRKSWWKWCND